MCWLAISIRLFAFSSELLSNALRMTLVMMMVMRTKTANTVSITHSVSLECNEWNPFAFFNWIIVV